MRDHRFSLVLERLEKSAYGRLTVTAFSEDLKLHVCLETLLPNRAHQKNTEILPPHPHPRQSL